MTYRHHRLSVCLFFLLSYYSLIVECGHLNNFYIKNINSVVIKRSIVTLGSSLCIFNIGDNVRANAAIDSSHYQLSSIYPIDQQQSMQLLQLKSSSLVLSNEFQDQLDILKKKQDIQQVLDAADIEFTNLPLGASYREFRVGTGNRMVKPGSTVSVEMTIRCVKLATAKEPGGVKYYDTKIDTNNNLYTWQVGTGQLPLSLEEGILGMKRNSIRRIELPSTLVFKARKDNQLPLPSEKDIDGNRRYKQLFKTDATLLFEVLVVSIKDTPPI
jgi:hypothetical protein